MPLRRRPLVALIGLAVVLLVAVAFLVRTPTADPTGTPTTSAAEADVPEDLEDFYEQSVTWTDCGGGAECARIEVPMDYADPTGERVELALKRLGAGTPGERLGSLLINPGGPGGSGTTLVDSASFVLSADLMDAYDVVGFDPRGVGDSTPITCVSDAELDALRAAVYDTSTPEGRDALRTDMIRLADACGANTGPLLGYVDTVSAARDMDIIRSVLGDERLTYLGYSYGTALGAAYADLFPTRVGRLVLDGGLDPTLDYAALGLGQAAGFEAALRSYAEDCLAGGDCPLTGSVDEAVGQVQRFFDLLAGSPLPTSSDRELTQSLAVSGVLLTLYDDQYWPILSEALRAAMTNRDGSQLLFLADLVADRQADGTYASNSTVALTAINCLDLPVNADPAAMDAEAEKLIAASPTFGRFFAYGEIACDVWPVDAVGVRGPLAAEGAAPILVIGTTGDPATPYAWSVALAEQLESGLLLTFDGEGHTAYGRSNDCVTDAVDGYLIDGAVPEDGLVC